MSTEKGNIMDSRWDEAIADARQKLIEGKAYVARVKTAIKSFEKNKAEGVPWPTRKRSTKQLRQQHSV
jgi:hypothetical protein